MCYASTHFIFSEIFPGTVGTLKGFKEKLVQRSGQDCLNRLNAIKTELSKKVAILGKTRHERKQATTIIVTFDLIICLLSFDGGRRVPLDTLSLSPLSALVQFSFEGRCSRTHE